MRLLRVGQREIKAIDWSLPVTAYSKRTID